MPDMRGIHHAGGAAAPCCDPARTESRPPRRHQLGSRLYLQGGVTASPRWRDGGASGALLSTHPGGRTAVR